MMFSLVKLIILIETVLMHCDIQDLLFLHQVEFKMSRSWMLKSRM